MTRPRPVAVDYIVVVQRLEKGDNMESTITGYCAGNSTADTLGRLKGSAFYTDGKRETLDSGSYLGLSDGRLKFPVCSVYILRLDEGEYDTGNKGGSCEKMRCRPA